MIEVLAQIDLVGWVGHFAVVFFRIVGLFIFLPIFSSQILPMKVRAALAILIALVFLPFAPRLSVAPTDVVSWVIVGLREFGAGFGLGVAAKAIFGGIEGAAQLVAGQSGFSLASMVDPATGMQSAAPNIFISLLAVALFLAADLHHIFIHAIERSYELLPPSVALPDFGSLDRLVSFLGMRLFTLAVELAGPALVVTIGVDLVLVLVGKALPQIPILIVGYPFKMAAGLVAMGMLAVATGSIIGWVGRTIASDGFAVLSAFAGR